MAVKTISKKPSLKSKISEIFKKDYETTSIRFCVRFLFFIAVWLYLWLGYGSVLYQMQDRSFWIFASPNDLGTLMLPSDLLTYLSRFALTTLTLPWLGALIISCFLSLIEILTSNILRLKGNLFVVSYIPSVAILFFISSTDYRIYYQYENSIIFKVLFITAIILALLALTRTIISGNSSRHNDSCECVSCKHIVIGLFLLIISSYAIIKYANRDKCFKALTEQEYYSDLQNWFKVAKIAEELEQMTRPVSTYHAIALANTGQLGDRLFTIQHDYDSITIPCKEGKYANPSILYSTEALLYSGMSLPAYHYAMEHTIIGYVNKHFIKIMVKCAVLNRDFDLARKLLTITSKMPFEGNFTKRFSMLIDYPENITKDPEMSTLDVIKPQYDSFEQTFGKPLYLNFYAMRNSGPEKAIELCMAACLYKKDSKQFMQHCDKINGWRIIPKHFQEAIVMMGMGQRQDFLKKFKISLDAYNEVKDFYQELANHSKDNDKGKKALRSKYGHTYMYYNTFENLPE